MSSACSLFCLLTFAILAPLITATPGSSAGEGNIARQIFYLLVFAIAVVSTLLNRSSMTDWLPPPSLMIVLFWFGLSMMWAVDVGVGARRLLLTSIVIFSLFILVELNGYDRTVAIVRFILPVVLLANYAAILASPGWAIHQAATTEDPSIVGAWRGIMMQKNFAGAACAYCIIFFLLDTNRLRRTIRYLIVAAAAFFLYKTQSKTSAGFSFMSVAIGFAFSAYNPRYRVVAIVFLLLGIVLAGILAAVNWDVLSAPFHKQDFLTGRVQIWPFLIQYWKSHWLLGSGYGSFWNVRNHQPIYEYTNGWVSELSSGHNGYLDMLVQTGLPGLIFAMCATVIAPLRVFLTSVSLSRSRGSLLLGCIWFSLCHNLTESDMFDRDATPHVFLMLAIALLTLEVRRNRRTANGETLHRA